MNSYMKLRDPNLRLGSPPNPFGGVRPKGVLLFRSFFAAQQAMPAGRQKRISVAYCIFYHQAESRDILAQEFLHTFPPQAINCLGDPGLATQKYGLASLSKEVRKT